MTAQEKYTSYINPPKLRRRQTTVGGRSLVEEFDSDRGRVLDSAPFRRLGNKAQVFSLERNASVRTRLTHSIEVAERARFIAQRIVKHSKFEEIASHDKEAVILLAQTACLLHDIGNPPFGHFGEKCISKWFSDKSDEILIASKLDSSAISNEHSESNKKKIRRAGKLLLSSLEELSHFDGNPQGFRIATTLLADIDGDEYSLNLTKPQLASTIKYPNGHSDQGDAKKFGVFSTELHIKNDIWSELKLDKKQRFPISYIMEAADDIAYCFSDIEDGIEKRVISSEHFATEIYKQIVSVEDSDDLEMGKKLNRLKKTLINISSAEGEKYFEPLRTFRSSLLDILIQQAAHEYIENHDAILDGKYENGKALLDGPSIANTLLGVIKKYARSNLYSSAVVRNNEITAHNVIYTLLDIHYKLIVLSAEEFNGVLTVNADAVNDLKLSIEFSLLGRFPKKYISAYKRSVYSIPKDLSSMEKSALELRYRLHLIVDYISGMTDEYAYRMAQFINGSQTNLGLF